jgi:hypothetical protein
MSTVRDTQGNILNPVGPGCERYTDENSLTVDWFASHPRPKVVEAIEIAKTEIRLAGLPEPTIDVTIPATIGEHTE